MYDLFCLGYFTGVAVAKESANVNNLFLIAERDYYIVIIYFYSVGDSGRRAPNTITAHACDEWEG